MSYSSALSNDLYGTLSLEFFGVLLIPGTGMQRIAGGFQIVRYYMHLLKRQNKAGEMAPLLRTLSVLPEVLC